MQRSRIEELLPVVYRRTLSHDGLLGSLLDLMETLHEPDETILSSVDRYLDPRRAPDDFVPFLAGWVDLGWMVGDDGQAEPVEPLPFPPGVGRLREAVAWSWYRSKWRGTVHGLVHFLEIATGLTGFRIDEAVRSDEGHPVPYHFRVHAPAEVEPLRVLIEKIVDHEKPAHVTVDPEVRFDA